MLNAAAKFTLQGDLDPPAQPSPVVGGGRRIADHCESSSQLVADLLDHLFTVNREPLWLVLEEADAFAPQQPMGSMTRVLGEVAGSHVVDVPSAFA